jgi:hypothetical protein
MSVLSLAEVRKKPVPPCIAIFGPPNFRFGAAHGRVHFDFRKTIP